MVAATEIVYPARGRDWFRQREREAVRLLGWTDGTWQAARWDVAYGINPTTEGSANTGAVDINPGEACIELTSGATASSYYEIYWGTAGAGANAGIVEIDTGGEWAIAGRMKLTTAINANANLHIGAFGADQLRIGGVGAVSTTKFAVGTASGNITSTLDLDTSWHEHLVYRRGGTTYYLIDGVQVGSSASAYPTTTMGSGYFLAQNGATAAARTMRISGQTIIYKRPA